MIRLPVPKLSYSEVEVTLGGLSYTLTYRFNSRSERWKMDLRDSEGVYIKKGMTLMANTSPTIYLHLPDFNHGDLFTLPTSATRDPVGRDNIGIGDKFELLYASVSEPL